MLFSRTFGFDQGYVLNGPYAVCLLPRHVDAHDLPCEDAVARVTGLLQHKAWEAAGPQGQGRPQGLRGCRATWAREATGPPGPGKIPF